MAGARDLSEFKRRERELLSLNDELDRKKLGLMQNLQSNLLSSALPRHQEDSPLDSEMDGLGGLEVDFDGLDDDEKGRGG